MIINKNGILIRIPVAELRIQGRATQGVKLINLKGNDEIAAVTRVEPEEEDKNEEEEETSRIHTAIDEMPTPEPEFESGPIESIEDEDNTAED